MNRRDLLKALGAVPIAGALGCRAHSSPAPNPGRDTRAHTLQILLEGAFAVVLQKQSQRLTAFVPQPDPARKDLAHLFCFNDPRNPRTPDGKSKGFGFKLSGEGLHKYGSPEPVPYINADFNDFRAETERWRLPPSLVLLDLPFPRSINFSGRPLKVRFGRNALKPTGLMPTNYIFEYRVEDEKRVELKCNHSEMHCEPSPNCPPGVLRYYFAVAPLMKDQAGRQKHAVDFFNFMLSAAFPDLAQKYEVVEIEQSDYEEPGGGGTVYPARLQAREERRLSLTPAVLRSDAPQARLLPVASLVDCQSGGMLVLAPDGPTG
jgi:hypothetical protein